jgi:hypothetical protein
MITVFEKSKTVRALDRAATGVGIIQCLPEYKVQFISSKYPYPNLAVHYEGISKSFRTGRLERELQMVQLSAIRCSCIAILWVSLVSFDAITICVASQQVFIVVSVYFGSGPHPASYPVGSRGSFRGVKRPGREADHSLPSSAEVKECVELYFHSPIRLHGVVLS